MSDSFLNRVYIIVFNDLSVQGVYKSKTAALQILNEIEEFTASTSPKIIEIDGDVFEGEYIKYISDIKRIVRDAYIQISRLAEAIRMGAHEGRSKFDVAEALMDAKKPLNDLMDILFPR